MTFDELKEKAHALPLKPGVYIMQDAKNEVIYVGKAKALKNRVSQYFANLASHTEKTRAMVSQIDHFDVIVADSEFEALILENSLIKRHQPHYNILLKDDKGYPYIRLTVKEPYLRFSLANRAAEDGARYFGPYGSRGSTQNIIDALRVALKLPSCSRKFPRDIGKERPCLNYHMGQCDGYCRKEMDQTRYREAIDQAVRLLEGQFKEVGEELLAEMEQAAEELRFEKAAELRDRFKAIELLGKRQKVVAGSLADTDVVGFLREPPGLLCGALTLWRASWRQGLGAHRDTHGGGQGGHPLRPGGAVLRRPGPPAPADPPALRAGGRGAPDAPFVPSRRGTGWSWSPPSGGPRWISSAWPTKTRWRRWSAGPPGRSGRAS